MRKLLCALVGHSELDVVEEYNRIEKQENGIDFGKGCLCAPRIRATIWGKFRCSRCQTVITGHGLQYRWIK